MLAATALAFGFGYMGMMLSPVHVCLIVTNEHFQTRLPHSLRGLLAPAGAGALLARRIRAMMAWAAAIGSLSVYLGLLASYHFNIAAGASIVMATVIIFFLVFFIQMLRGQRVYRLPLRPPHE